MSLRGRDAAFTGKRSTLPLAGDVFLMYVSNVEQWKWPLVKIEEVIASDDGHVQSAVVQDDTGKQLRRLTCHWKRKTIPFDEQYFSDSLSSFCFLFAEVLRLALYLQILSILSIHENRASFPLLTKRYVRL